MVKDSVLVHDARLLFTISTTGRINAMREADM